MPNWCYNTIEIEGPKRAIDTFEKHLDTTEGKEWFSYFIQIPEELKEDGWYEWNVNNYGVKWNCDAMDWNRTSDTSISFTFDSPWGPPIQLYETIESIELESEWGSIDYYKVTARYLEEGMQFMGQYIEGENEEYEYSDLDSLDEIPDSLVEHWGVRDRMLDDMDNDDDWALPEYTEEQMVEDLEKLKAEFDKLPVEGNEEKKN